MQAPLEAQGRGFTHGHGKGHSVIGATIKWLRNAATSGLTTAVHALREALLGTAATVQYDAAREPARQLGVELRPEPLTARQQRQSRMDGGEEEDGTEREHVELSPPVDQPHLERERHLAAAESRLPRLGSAAYREVPLTGAFQSTFPAYRQRSHFGELGHGQTDTPCLPSRRLEDIFGLDEQGRIVEVLLPNGTASSEADLAADAKQWAAHYGQDVFNNHCTNHNHDCTATCVKYVKQKLEAKQSLRSHRVPSCRFWYFRVVTMKDEQGREKRKRRRGKPLVSEPHIEETDGRNQQFRCQLRREHPFRSTSNDVAQVSDRANVDFQFLSCAPPAPPDAQPAGAGNEAATATTGSTRQRLRKKTRAVPAVQKPAFKKQPRSPTWFPGSFATLTSQEQACATSFAASFRKAAAMDFYITKYQGKPMESLTPLFKCMTDGVHRLERQLEEEEAEAEKAREADAEETGLDAARKHQKTMADVERRARRLTIRLASMANRCFWVSAAELTVHILTDGDCLQSHKNMFLFTKQLQWAMQQCKKHLNNEPLEEQAEETLRVQAVTLHVKENEVAKVEASTHSTNDADDYAHRGPKLWNMPFYVYRMYVRKIAKPSKDKGMSATMFEFEAHYNIADRYVQEVVLHNVHVPSIHGFGCPTAEQDAEQNALLKAILFTPWTCTDPMTCGSVLMFQHHLSNGDDGHRTAGAASQPAVSSSSSSGAQQRTYEFHRAWRLRRAEIHVRAERADGRSLAARKKLVLADTTLFADRKEPKAEVDAGEELKKLLMRPRRAKHPGLPRHAACLTFVGTTRLLRAAPGHGVRAILAFLGMPCRWHDEQCTVAEFSAYIARDVIAHVDLAAEARHNKGEKPSLGEDCEEESVDDDSPDRTRRGLEVEDIGGGDHDADDAETHDVRSSEFESRFVLHDVETTLSLCLQQRDLASIDTKRRKSQSDKDLEALDKTYESLLQQDFAMDSGAKQLARHGFREHYPVMAALQKQNILLAKKQQTPEQTRQDEEGDDACMAIDAPPAPQPEWVPFPLAMQGPAAVALKLLTDAACTEEQTDAVALLALSMQKRFDARPDKSSVLLPVATATNNHRAMWLGGGGVGKTRTLCEVVQPLAETFFGPDGYSATAQSNHAAQNLGSKGRTLHSANGLLMMDSLQTARLSLPDQQTQKKMDRLAGNLGVDVIDELGAVPADLLHADALRKTYGRCLRHNLNTRDYMKPAETWGRMAGKILSGDFYQLPPVPKTASLLASPIGLSYEHQQGRKLLMDIEYVVDFVQMQRFDDPLLVEVLEAMRTPGGKKITQEAWRAIQATKIKGGDTDPRLREARNWYECAYEWRIVSYAMHANARLNAKAAGRLLYYIPSIDYPPCQMTREDFDDMRGQPNIGQTAKFPGILPVYIGMEMILDESYLPPRIVRGAPVEVLDIELHDDEPAIRGRASIASHGCVVLKYMPKCIYVRLLNNETNFLGSPDGVSTDLQGVLAVHPIKRSWSYKRKTGSAVSVVRLQCPVLPRKQTTLHGVQGKTADPGIIAHWTFPVGSTPETKWLAHYVILSRPRSLAKMLSHGLPDRDLIEGGPPEEIAEAFQELFAEKIAATKLACARARAEMGWPARPV